MSQYKVIKSVSFNIKNEEDRLCLDKINGINFSGYVKKLIVDDIKRKSTQKSEKGGIKIIVGK